MTTTTIRFNRAGFKCKFPEPTPRWRGFVRAGLTRGLRGGASRHGQAAVGGVGSLGMALLMVSDSSVSLKGLVM